MLASTIRSATSWAEEAGVAMMPMISSASATLLELVYVLDDDVADGASDLLRVVVEDVVNDEALLGKIVLAAMALPRLPAPTSAML